MIKNSLERIEDKDLKRIELEILIFVDNFCKKNSIQYSLTGGTLLGAVRHKGFIPWDDDIDIMLERRYYDRFLKEFPLCSEDTNYKLICYSNTNNYNYLFAKIVDKRTILCEDHNKSIDSMGVFIDVFPIDYIDDNYERCVKKLKKIEFAKYLTVASNWKHYYVNKNHGFLRQIPRLLFFLLSRFINPKKILKRIEKKCVCSESKRYAACICGTYSIKNELMDSSIFSNYNTIVFEGTKLLSISEYHSYLCSLYGDYMVLPPIEKRIPRHTFKAFYRSKYEKN